MKLIKPIILFIVSSFFSLMCSAVTITPIVSENAESDDTDRPCQGCSDKILNASSTYIVVFGDLQTYTMGRYIDYYSQSCNWVRKQYDEGINISCILQDARFGIASINDRGEGKKEILMIELE